MVNTVFQITYNLLTPVIYLAVYMAVRDNPASPKLQQLSGRDIHKHTRFLVINPVIHTTDASSACFTHFLFNGFQSLTVIPAFSFLSFICRLSEVKI